MGQAGDFPSFIGHHLVCTKRAWQLIQPIITNSVELLPLTCREAQYFVIKINDLVDPLDYSKSIYEDGFGGLIKVKSYVFNDEIIKNKHMFWFSRGYLTVVSETFKTFVEDHHLKSLIFRQLQML
ncbi:imm11 family protein [Anabaena sp. PCC 7938]|uniref:imm11 family protein n=1 Tax=Anabaena sp. PCC 7938 TaxID=1296340 RepID=UPI003BEF0A2A